MTPHQTPTRSRDENSRRRPSMSRLRLRDQTPIAPNTPTAAASGAQSPAEATTPSRLDTECRTPTQSTSAAGGFSTPRSGGQPLDGFSTPQTARTPLRRTQSAIDFEMDTMAAALEARLPEDEDSQMPPPAFPSAFPPMTPARSNTQKRRHTGSPNMLRENIQTTASGEVVVSVARNLTFGPIPLHPYYRPDGLGGYVTQVFDGERRPLGRGDFGVVIGVRIRPEDGRRFAIKIQPSMTSAEARYVQFREIFFLENLRHPNVLRLNSAWEQFGHMHIMTELCSKNLYEFMEDRNGRVPESIVWNAFLDGMRGLSYLHSRGVLHLDVKPHNMLICRRGVVKLADFGMAFNMHKDNPEQFELDGDGRYLAPEAFDEVTVKGLYLPATPKRDVFSLGVSIFQFATNLQMTGKGDQLGMAREKNFPEENVRACPDRLRPILFSMMENDVWTRPSIPELLEIGEVEIREAGRSFHLREVLGIELPEIVDEPIPDSEWAKLMASRFAKPPPIELNHTIG